MSVENEIRSSKYWVQKEIEFFLINAKISEVKVNVQ